MWQGPEGRGRGKTCCCRCDKSIHCTGDSGGSGKGERAKAGAKPAASGVTNPSVSDESVSLEEPETTGKDEAAKVAKAGRATEGNKDSEGREGRGWCKFQLSV